MKVRGRFREGVFGYGFIYLMEDVPVRAGAHLRRRVSSANTAGFWVGGERSSLGGDKDHERSEYRSILERKEFVVRNGAYAEWRMTISQRK